MPLLLGPPTPSVRYLVYCRLWSFGMAVHLLLPDVWQDGWLAPNLLGWLAALLLAATGAPLGWALASVALLWPLLFLHDQLTQSALMLVQAVGAISCFAGPATGRSDRMRLGAPLMARTTTVLTYALSVFHKLNRGFLDPDVSCATAGTHVLARNWGLSALAAPALDPIWPFCFLAAEILLAVLLVVRPAIGIALAMLLHVPLTIVFAPAFAFVMIPGLFCTLTEDDVQALGRALRRDGRWILPMGAALGVGSFLLYLRHHSQVYWFWSFKEALLWVGLVWIVVAYARRPPGAFAAFGAWAETVPRSLRLVAVLLVSLRLAHALTPYLGLGFHHTGAMLSNLRIDRGCWNHVLLPESMRLRDPYVRIDEVRSTDRAVAEALAARLWGPEALHELRAKRCRRGSRAGDLSFTARYRGRRLRVDDLCAPGALDALPVSWPGVRAFQTNLPRQCPHHCIH